MHGSPRELFSTDDDQNPAPPLPLRLRRTYYDMYKKLLQISKGLLFFCSDGILIDKSVSYPILAFPFIAETALLLC